MVADSRISTEIADVIVEPDWVVIDDGTPLAITVYRPNCGEPQPCLVEALPYRQDDVTASYAATYQRLASEFGYAVCRVDVRGTGSSGGIASDEYPDVERSDLKTVFRWLAAQPWCTGRIGMFGTSYSGFNSLHLAADAPPELGAVAAIYATDDRYTDDVHYCGGVLKAVDLVDYCAYMVPMNALPPVPSRWATRPGSDAGPDWLDEWRRRIESTPPWLLDWMGEQTDSPMWRRGSIRLGPDGEGYERITVPTMLIAGWADGYRNNTFRTAAELQRNDVAWRVLAGPWAHADPARSRPGPHLDLDLELVRWFDEHLRDRPPAASVAPLQVFVRSSTRPEPDLAEFGGEWRTADDPRPARVSEFRVCDTAAGPAASGLETLDVAADVGLMAWISCAGALPWGQSLDQRVDDARSLTYEWPAIDPIELIGNAAVRVRVRSSAPVATLVAKLCDVFPDGTSSLITRGTLNLTHRGVWPVDGGGSATARPQALVAGEWYHVTIELEAIAHRVVAGNRLRLVLAGSDWPNIWATPAPVQLGIEPSSIVVTVPTLDLHPGGDRLPMFAPGDGVTDVDDDIEWRFEHDVLRRVARAFTRYGGPYGGADGATVCDSYVGEVGVGLGDPADAWAIGTSSFEIGWLEGTCRSEATITVRSNAASYSVEIDLAATLDGEPFAAKSWRREIPRELQ